ncbi:hypothetical protein PG993_008439 [Apiospora rasikravindrae]|uniref:Uncharacterized protein n=1 Tax=Apiospora rasikravindrae TaxID=990691 RepID=A0ABR1T0C2_9PEZI
MRGTEPPAYPPSICMTQPVITVRKCEIVIFPLPSPPRRSFVLSSRLATPKSTICTEDSSDRNIAISIAPHSNFKSERNTNYLSPLLPAIQSFIKTIMWQQPPIEGRSKRIVRIHHKLVKSRQQLTQALKKHLQEGEDFYFEMRNDFYIIQVYGPKDFDVESTQRSMLGNDAKVAGIEVVNEEMRDSRLCC